MKEVFILLGSNRGDRKDLISVAAGSIDSRAGRICKRSGLYESEPWGFEDPTPFLNQVVEIDTSLDPESLLEHLLTIEASLGRIRPFAGCGCDLPSRLPPAGESGNEVAPAYTARTIDLDILFYGSRMIFTDTLMIPHPRLHERRFTLVPMNEIAPGFVHPLLKKTISVLLHDCRDKSEIKAFLDPGP